MRLQPFTGDNPTGALLVLADSPVETILQDCVFYRLPAPALAVINSTVRLNNTEVSALPSTVVCNIHVVLCRHISSVALEESMSPFEVGRRTSSSDCGRRGTRSLAAGGSSC